MKILFTALMLLLSTHIFAAHCRDALIPSAALSDKGNKEVANYLNAVGGTSLFSDESVSDSYCGLHAWYEKRMSSRRFGSRTLALLVIVLGALLPLIGILDKTFVNQKFWVAFIAAAIVVAQGVSQTFQYDESWRHYTLAKLQLESAHRAWQTRIIEASLQTDGVALAKTATNDFDAEVSNIVLKETSGFFDSVAQGSKGPSDRTGTHE